MQRKRRSGVNVSAASSKAAFMMRHAVCPTGALANQPDFAEVAVLQYLMAEPHGAHMACRRIVAALENVVRAQPGTRLGPADGHAMALTQGLAHGAAYSLFFYFRWRPRCARVRGTAWEVHRSAPCL